MHRPLVLAACLAICTVMSASALELPPRKAGLWEIKMTFELNSNPMQTVQHCIDAATDKLMNANIGGMAKENCPKQEMTDSGNSFTVDSVCTFGNVTTTSSAVFTGDFDNAYTVKVTSTRTGGTAMRNASAAQVSRITIDAKWTGACKSGQKPGDMILPDGRKMNVLEMREFNRRSPPR